MSGSREERLLATKPAAFLFTAPRWTRSMALTCEVPQDFKSSEGAPIDGDLRLRWQFLLGIQ